MNEHLRLGLDRASTAPAERFTVVTRPMGLRPGLSLDSASALLEWPDGPAAR